MSGLDLFQTQRPLALMLVYAAVSGFGIGLLYDCLRVLRAFCGDSLRPTKKRSLGLRILLFAEDVLTVAVAAVVLILLCYYTNDGQLRAPAILGMACGFFVYIRTLGRVTARIAVPLAARCKRLAALPVRLLLRWLRWIIGLMGCLARGLWRMTAGKLLIRHRDRQTEKYVRHLTDSARDGFDLPASFPISRSEKPDRSA